MIGVPAAFDPTPTGKAVLSIVSQLEDSQWLSADALEAAQLGQLAVLLDHAARTIPFYGKLFADAGIDLSKPFDLETWRRIPLLTRREVQRQGAALKTSDLPGEHGDIITTSSSGSTGMPVTVHGTTLDAFFFTAIKLRHHLWQGHDFSHKMVSIRKTGDDAAPYPLGAAFARWGDSAAFPFPTGPSASLNIGTPIASQIEWLQRQDPAYLLTYPTNLLSLIEASADRGITLPHLDQALTLGEALPEETRELCRKNWNVKIADTYSAAEVGAMALQCPEHEHYHVQAESVRLEVLDNDGRPCQPGDVGRVVVTPLYNFAMPLIRYEIGDYAEVGEPCSCGRGLPVLKRILGRARNMFVTPRGDKIFLFVGAKKLSDIAPIIQHRFIQKSVDLIEVQFVVERPFTEQEMSLIRERLNARLPFPCELDFKFVEEIPRGAGGKYEDFISEVV